MLFTRSLGLFQRFHLADRLHSVLLHSMLACLAIPTEWWTVIKHHLRRSWIVPEQRNCGYSQSDEARDGLWAPTSVKVIGMIECKGFSQSRRFLEKACCFTKPCVFSAWEGRRDRRSFARSCTCGVALVARSIRAECVSDCLSGKV